MSRCEIRMRSGDVSEARLRNGPDDRDRVANAEAIGKESAPASHATLRQHPEIVPRHAPDSSTSAYESGIGCLWLRNRSSAASIRANSRARLFGEGDRTCC